MKPAKLLLTTVLALPLASTALANTYGSVEPIANPAVIDTRSLRDASLDVRENPRGQDYLSRIPVESHQALRRIRRSHLSITREVLRKLEHHDPAATQFRCR